jgi:hypothetical protein
MFLQGARLKETELLVSVLVIILILFGPVLAVENDEVFRIHP